MMLKHTDLEGRVLITSWSSGHGTHFRIPTYSCGYGTGEGSEGSRRPVYSHGISNGNGSIPFLAFIGRGPDDVFSNLNCAYYEACMAPSIEVG